MPLGNKVASVTAQKKMGISYGRVSTFDQAFHKDGSRREDASPEAQRQRCVAHMEILNKSRASKYEILEHISDEGVSGKNTNRAGYQRMWDLIATEEVNFIVASELSRISRSVLDFLELAHHCKQYNVSIFIIGLDLDTESPFGRVMLTILVALAEFERNVTSQRVKENALIRLLNDGKINGAAEILGLDKDPDNKGHFLVNHEELLKVELIFKIFMKFSSKNKVLAEARRLGLTGKKGKELTQQRLTIILENARWRYRGLWFANKENEHEDQADLPENKRYQHVELPHGPLLEVELLDAVDQKLKDTYDKKKRSGKDGRIYLLSHILEYEDGSKYSGGPGKDRQYFYYYTKGPGPNIRCEAIEEIVIERIKGYFKGNDIFKKLVESALKKREADLPKIDRQISLIEKELAEIAAENTDLKNQLRDKDSRERSGFMAWLEGEVVALQLRKEAKEAELADYLRAKKDIAKKSGLESLDATATDFIEKFSSLTGVEKRNFIERMIDKIIVKKDNKLELHVLWEPKRSVTRTTKSTVSELDNGRDGT
jgi:DNA invertase Pin-like site-specific DNA recombinase